LKCRNLCYSQLHEQRSSLQQEEKMKVLLVNGSPHEKGCTYTALCEVGAALDKEGIEADHFWIGNKPLAGCIGCGYCMKNGRCRYDDSVNRFLDLAKDHDGFVFGAPVHFASAAASMIAFMTRAFFVDQFSGLRRFMFKPGAAVVSARRAGTTAALEELNKYLLYAQMPIATSRYWNMVHGQTPEDVKRDAEGLQIMRVLGKNMAWLLKCIEAGRNAGIKFPEQEERISTNFGGSTAREEKS
jgi:multimeric flavodoxin WrbA